jgi:hypothetical protein
VTEGSVAFRVAGLCCALVSACGGASKTAETAPVAPEEKPLLSRSDDKSRCDYRGRADREVVESDGPGADFPNVRRVFGVLGSGDDRHRVLICREIDTNLDGTKDVVRTFNDHGEAVGEEADTNYDGKVDTWIRFAGGHINKVEVDLNADGRPDETRYYLKGKLSRVHRDTNRDGRPDVWEVYTDGHLERIGVDLDFDGHVDRWDRDEVAHKIAEQKEREEEAKALAAKKAADQAEADAAAKSKKGSASAPAKKEPAPTPPSTKKEPAPTP